MSARSCRPLSRAVALLALLAVTASVSGCAQVSEEIGQMIGEVIGRELGSYLLMPAVLTGICWWIAYKFAADKAYSFALGVTGAQGLVALLAIILQAQAGYIDSVGGLLLGLFEVVWLALGTVWLALRPSLAPVALLIVYQAVAVFQRIGMLGFDLPENFVRAIYGHIIISIVAAIALVLCYLATRSEKSPP